MRAFLWIVIAIDPLFAILDYLLAPAWLGLLWSIRVFMTVATVSLLLTLKWSAFARHANVICGGYVILWSSVISLMTVLMGGLASPYYAGLCLVMVGVGLLFVWPARVVLITHGVTVASFVVPNLIFSQPTSTFRGLSNVFFLLSTAIIASAGQVLTYKSLREQLVNQLTIEHTKANLEKAHEQLKQLDHFKSEFFANITHELKTPLAMILTPLELMLEGRLDAKSIETQRGTLEGMYRSGVKLLRLIEDLLDLSKLEESRLRLRIDEHDLVVFLRGLLAQVQTLAQRKNILLHFDSNTDSSVVWCDLERIERVFINLLSNATKFTPAGGNVWLTVEDSQERVSVEVRDDGPGFPPDKSTRVFERFFQVDMGGTRKYGGTGIGLALAKELVELHGGSISAKSRLGEGASFTVDLLKDRAHFPATAIDRRERLRDLPGGQREADRGLTEWTTQLTGREEFRLLEIAEATEQRVVDRDPDEADRAYTILVAEDSPDVVRVIHMALRDHFRILAASDGKKGLELAVRELPSLIITDLMMPEIDGLELTRRLRADPRTRHIPIVMLTARADLEDRVSGLDTGVNAYLAKPFAARELLSTVRSLVGSLEASADLLLRHEMDSLEVVSGALAHEINNPLNYIKNSLELAEDHIEQVLKVAAAGQASAEESQRLDVLARRTQKLFEVAGSGIKRIGATVALMRRYSREGYSRAPQPYDAFAAARDVVSVVVPATGRDVKVELSLEGEGVIDCVPEEFNQVLTNLVQNAVEAAPEGTGCVRIAGRCEEGFVALSVTDNGPGVRSEDRAKIFTPFFTTKGPGRGMGMGLTIAQRVVAGAGGTIRLKSQLGAGAEFVVRVPKRRSPGSKPPAARNEPPHIVEGA
jgi:signal transduction histidine kinase